jgi:DNA-binding NtrC family response regulator
MKIGMRKTILLVDDDDTVREMVHQVLRAGNYEVVEACSGAEAIQLADEHPGKIQMLLSDVVMPEVTGLELAERMERARPEMKVLLMSGYDKGLLVLDHGWQFIAKPFLPTALLEKIRETLELPADGPRPSPPAGADS